MVLPLAVHEDGAAVLARRLLVLGALGGLALVLGHAAELKHARLERDARELADLHAHGSWAWTRVNSGAEAEAPRGE